MFRKWMIGVAACVALAVVAPTNVFARGGGFGGGGGFHGGGGGGFHGGGFGGGGFHGGGFGGGFHGGGFRSGGGFGMGGARFAGMPGAGFHGNFSHRGRHFRRFAPFVVGFGVPYFYDDYYYGNYPYDGCYRATRVHTRYGWRWRQINVCG